MAEYLFVYGTLRPAVGHSRAQLLTGDEPAGPGRISGRLYDTGPYPAAVPADASSDVVHGDVFLLKDPELRLKELDQEEGIAPAEGLFRREKAAVVLEDGRSVEAWVYYWCGSTDFLMTIPSGDYLLHLKGK